MVAEPLAYCPAFAIPNGAAWVAEAAFFGVFHTLNSPLDQDFTADLSAASLQDSDCNSSSSRFAAIKSKTPFHR